jgi:hypothetical protein
LESSRPPSAIGRIVVFGTSSASSSRARSAQRFSPRMRAETIVPSWKRTLRFSALAVTCAAVTISRRPAIQPVPV